MYLTIDQYGYTVLLETAHPRKELMLHHNTTQVEKMYIDTTDGGAQHIGYIVAGHWYTLYELTLFNGT